MSGPFALGAVSAVLRRLLTEGPGDVDLSIFGGAATNVTAFAPDQIQAGANEPAQLNLFLYRVSPNLGLNSSSLPTRTSAGDRIANPMLALDLHYLLTAYGAQELVREALLGYGMNVLNDVPFLTRDFIRSTWPGGGVDAVEQAFANSGLADQIESIKISPEALPTEELSRLWTAFQAKFRPSAAYQATVVLIQSVRPAKAALPVLKQGQEGGGPSAQGDLVPPVPDIDALRIPGNRKAIRIGDTFEILGHDFAGFQGDPLAVTVTVRLLARLVDGDPGVQAPDAQSKIQRDILVAPSQRDDRRISVTVPDEPVDLPVAPYTLSVIVAPNGEPDKGKESGIVPVLLAPRITTGLPASFPAGPIKLSCTPEVRRGQRVSLILGSRELPAQPMAAQGPDVSFDATGLPPGGYWVRLRVSNIDSLLIDRSDLRKPAFDPSQQITLT